MEELLYILPRGLAVGILVSAPMGPIGMLVLQRTLSKGRWPAMFTGFGAAVSDLTYSLLAGFCLSFITGFIETHQTIIQLLGAAVLAGFGFYLFRKKPSRPLKVSLSGAGNYWKDFVTGFLLTFSNPLILFFIIGLFARFNLVADEYTFLHYSVAYLSIIVGALLWWYAVTTVVSKIGRRISDKTLRMINLVIGIFLLIMALGGICIAVYYYFQ